MKNAILLVILAMTHLIPVSADPIQQNAYVKWVSDGDTVKVRTEVHKQISVRLVAIDCPEVRFNNKCRQDAYYGRPGCKWQIPHGKTAKSRAIELLLKKNITLECPGTCETDKYNRSLRYIRLPDAQDFGELMLREGLCRDVSTPFPHPRSATYKQAEQEAKQQGRGIWAE